MERNLEYEKEIRDIVEQYPKNFMKMLKSKAVHKDRTVDRTHLWNYILEQTHFLDSVKTTNSTRIAFCLHHITEIPKCANLKCNNKMPYVRIASINDLTLKPKCCSKKCSRKIAHEAFVKYCQETYGPEVTNVFQLPSVINKAEETRLKNIGVKYAAQSREIWIKSRKKYTYNGIKFDSTWEIVYYEYLKRHDIPFEFQPKSNFTYQAEGKTHNYYPDFFLPTINKYIEIKDERTFKKYLKENAVFAKHSEIAMQSKLRMVKELEKENKVIVLDSHKMKPYFDWFKEEFGQRYKEYLRQFKNK